VTLLDTAVQVQVPAGQQLCQQSGPRLADVPEARQVQAPVTSAADLSERWRGSVEYQPGNAVRWPENGPWCLLLCCCGGSTGGAMAAG